jgi:Chondroitinase B
MWLMQGSSTRFCHGMVRSGVIVLAALLLQAASSMPQSTFDLPVPAPFAAMATDDLRALARSEHPELSIDGNRLTVAMSSQRAGVRFQGRCVENSRVVISGHAVKEPLIAQCSSGQYSVQAESKAVKSGSEIVATQLLVNGSLVVARMVDAEGPAVKMQSSADLHQLSEVDGGRILIPPGRYSDIKLEIPTGVNITGKSLIIDGGGAVTFTGHTEFHIARSSVTLTGLRFEDSGDTSIAITGSDVRIADSEFIGCGQISKPQSQCIFVAPSAKGAEIDFNRFSGSYSMTIKLRADATGSHLQPINAYIHHNAFRNIEKRSDNGQEPIQVAGPGGAGSEDALHARIEHNIFDAANGDVEAISLKTPGVRVRWNIFSNMDAAPNFRGSSSNEISGNILIQTRGIRIAGSGHAIVGNIVVCPRGPAFMLTHGSTGYANAERNQIESNLVVSRKGGVMFLAQEQRPTMLAQQNVVSGNSILASRHKPGIADQSEQRNPWERNAISKNSIQIGAELICR